jgi:hypothetical protein
MIVHKCAMSTLAASMLGVNCRLSGNLRELGGALQLNPWMILKVQAALTLPIMVTRAVSGPPRTCILA